MLDFRVKLNILHIWTCVIGPSMWSDFSTVYKTCHSLNSWLNWAISDLAPVWHQALSWTNVDISFLHSGTHLSEIWIKRKKNISLKKIHWKMLQNGSHLFGPHCVKPDHISVYISMVTWKVVIWLFYLCIANFYNILMSDRSSQAQGLVSLTISTYNEIHGKCDFVGSQFLATKLKQIPY